MEGCAPFTKDSFLHRLSMSGDFGTFAVEICCQEKLPKEAVAKLQPRDSWMAESRFGWTAYAYIRQPHPAYSYIEEFGEDSPVVIEMPLHGGCTWFERLPDGLGFKVGADYSHCGDGYYQANCDDCVLESVLGDARRLHEFLSQDEAFYRSLCEEEGA